MVRQPLGFFLAKYLAEKTKYIDVINLPTKAMS